ncbi:MAG: hypothetical protein R2874_11005 [Desulfobacterales bacterium]
MAAWVRDDLYPRYSLKKTGHPLADGVPARIIINRFGAFYFFCATAFCKLPPSIKSRVGGGYQIAITKTGVLSQSDPPGWVFAS